jgi:hypothetical protein
LDEEERMAIVMTRLADSQYVAGSAAAIVTNASGHKTYVRLITVYNGNATSETVRVYRVPDSGGSVGTAGPGNQKAQLYVPASETVFFEIPGPGWILEDTNDTVQADTTTANKVVVSADGFDQA